MTASSSVTLLGIDPGFDRMGWCIGTVERGQTKVLAYGCIQPPANADIVRRYQALDTELSAIIEKYQPQEAALESLFFSHNQTTAMKVSEARGVIISALFRHQVKCAEYTPQVIKVAVTGDGRATKKAVLKMIELQLGKSHSIGLHSAVDDTIDAIAIFLTHAASRRK